MYIFHITVRQYIYLLFYNNDKYINNLVFGYDNLVLENIAQVLLLLFKLTKNVSANCLILINISNGRSFEPIYKLNLKFQECLKY